MNGINIDDEEELRIAYWENGLSAPKIADKSGCHSSTVYRKMEEFDIPRRNSGIPRIEGGICGDKDALKEAYQERGLSIRDIAEKDGCSKKAVHNHLIDFEIPRREAFRSRLELEICNDEDALRNAYREEGLTIKEIAEKDGCSERTVAKRMDEHDVLRKKDQCATYYVDSGYGRWNGTQSENGREHVSVHQLLACLDHDPHEVFAEDTNVHHGADRHPELPPVELPFANWEGNLEVMSASEHTAYHNRNSRWNLENTEPVSQAPQ